MTNNVAAASAQIKAVGELCPDMAGLLATISDMVFYTGGAASHQDALIHADNILQAAREFYAMCEQAEFGSNYDDYASDLRRDNGET